MHSVVLKLHSAKRDMTLWYLLSISAYLSTILFYLLDTTVTMNIMLSVLSCTGFMYLGIKRNVIRTRLITANKDYRDAFATNRIS